MTNTHVDLSSHRSQLFTVRLWTEDLGDGQLEWRGQVQHVLSGEMRYFREWEGLVEFLQLISPNPQAKDKFST